MLRGRRIMERLFPGLEAELAAEGAPVLDLGSQVLWLTTGGTWGARFVSGLRVLSCSRDLLEWAIRRRLAAHPNVRIVGGHAAEELTADRSGVSVTGVRVRAHAGDDAQGVEDWIAADLVVDAGGRGSRAPRWLRALGYAAPGETRIDAHLGYASRLYRMAAVERPEWRGVFIQAAPPRITRGAALFPIEGGVWQLTLYGVGRDYPPDDEAGFLAFAGSLRAPQIHAAVERAEPVSPIVTYRATENRRRHFERLDHWPERFVVLGDGACAFNPVYAQGMTTAALGAEVLDTCLREQRARQPGGDLLGLARRFQRRLAAINAAPWSMATGEDLRVRGVEGGTAGPLLRALHWYLDRVADATCVDIRVRQAWLEAMHMLVPPSALLRPRVAARVAWQSLRRRGVSVAASSTPVSDSRAGGDNDVRPFEPITATR